MGQATRLRDLIGVIKDKASQGKAALSLSRHLALLRATTHDPSTPPSDKHIAAVLSSGDSSRASASAAIHDLMNRLQDTQDSSVALKCLIIIHRIIKHGNFILQDQLSIYPFNGGRNYLKLSGFRDDSTAVKWELSSWVRWYARYLETLLSTSRVLGFFLCSSSNTLEREKEEEKVSSLLNSDLLKEFHSLVGLLEEICQRPDFQRLNANKLLEGVMVLVVEDYLSVMNEVLLRVNEFKERLSCLNFAESVELVCALNRLEDCEHRLADMYIKKKAFIESFWGAISEMKNRIGSEKVYGEEGRFLITMGRSGRASESARFGERAMKRGDSVRFSSARLGLTSLPVPESANSFRLLKG